MKKLWSRCFPDKSVRSKKSNCSDVESESANVESVEINAKEDHRDDRKNQMNINDFPSEILYLIIEKLDKEDLFYCFFVCRLWRSIFFRITRTGKGSMLWCFLYKQYLMDSYYQENSNTNNLPYIELIESSLKWNYKCSVSLSKSDYVTDVAHMTVYREYIIVLTKHDVKYYDKKTFKIKKTIRLDKCCEFIENDFMVARSKKCNGGYKLQLFGKRTIDDNEWESQITRDISEIVTAKELYVRLFKIQENHCFVILKCNNTLCSHHWKHAENPVEWYSRFRCRYYGSSGEILAMHLGLDQVYLLTSRGALFCHQRQRGGVNIKRVYKFTEIMQPGYVQLVHKYNVILSVPDGSPGRIMRIHAGEEKLGYPTLYRFEISRLTCVAEHGIVLFLGFSDGKVKVIRPMDSSREYINKHLIDLSVFGKGPPAPVVSIAVHVDQGEQRLFIATTSCVYRLIPTFSNEKNIWDKENMAGISCAPNVELVNI